MRITNGHTLRIHNSDNWWGHTCFFTYYGKVYKRRAARGLMDSLLKDVKRKQI